MELIPAIDLLDGKVVRLYQGDYNRSQVYSDDPPAIAEGFRRAGASRVHVVDLDGARSGNPTNHGALRDIVTRSGLPVQTGGGIRSLETARSLVELGVGRVIFGTAAVRDPDLVRRACEELGPEAVVVGVDARDGRVVVQGWLESSNVSAADLVRRMADLGVVRFIYTDVSRDGTMTEPNFDAIRALVRDSGVAIVASGGIASVEHLEMLAETGAEGAIVGRALYDGAIDLEAAVRALA